MQTYHSSVAGDIAWFKQCLADQNLVAALKNIKLVISDVDGTLTDTTVYVDQAGEGGRTFSVQDGYIVKPAMLAGITITFMSGKDNFSTIQRARKLGIPEDLCIVGIDTKPMFVAKIQQKLNISIDQTLLIGDDFLDAEVKLQSATKLYACPENTPFYLQQLADIIVPRTGGDGAFRLLMDLVLYVQKKHFAQVLIEKMVA